MASSSVNSVGFICEPAVEVKSVSEVLFLMYLPFLQAALQMSCKPTLVDSFVSFWNSPPNFYLTCVSVHTLHSLHMPPPLQWAKRLPIHHVHVTKSEKHLNVKIFIFRHATEHKHFQCFQTCKYKNTVWLNTMTITTWLKTLQFYRFSICLSVLLQYI